MLFEFCEYREIPDAPNGKVSESGLHFYISAMQTLHGRRHWSQSERAPWIYPQTFQFSFLYPKEGALQPLSVVPFKTHFILEPIDTQSVSVGRGKCLFRGLKRKLILCVTKPDFFRLDRSIIPIANWVFCITKPPSFFLTKYNMGGGKPEFILSLCRSATLPAHQFTFIGVHVYSYKGLPVNISFFYVKHINIFY